MNFLTDKRTTLVYWIGEELNEKIKELLELTGLKIWVDKLDNWRMLRCSFETYDGSRRVICAIRTFVVCQKSEDIYRELSRYLFRFYIQRAIDI